MIKKYKQNEIEIMSEILKNDGVICVPTDTVYGICGSIKSIKAYNKLIKIKNRPTNKSFPVMCANEKQIKDIARVNENAEKLIKAFMPGPITIVLEKNSNLPDYVTNEKNTIAVRMATSKALEELILKSNCPIFMTSANKSGEPTCNSIDEIEKACPDLDGIMEGNVIFSEGSTIVDCTSNYVKILRSGPISEEQIINALN